MGSWVYDCLASGVDEGFGGRLDSYDPSCAGRWMALVAGLLFYGMLYGVKGRCCAAQSPFD